MPKSWIRKHHHTEEAKRRISESKRGKRRPDMVGNTLWKLSRVFRTHQGFRGRHHTKETRKKMRGHISWNKGLTKDDPRVRKHCFNAGNIKRCQHLSPQTEFKNGHKWSKEVEERRVRRILRALKRRPNKLEKKFIELIEKHSLPYKYCGDNSLLIGWKNPDFYEQNGKKVCVEVANHFHHPPPWKEERKEHFERYGWKCYFFYADPHNNFELPESRIVEVLKAEKTNME